MPTAQKHNTQYESNKRLLTELSNLQQPPYDWIITVAFYCAVHLIEKELFRHNIDSWNHTERKKKMKEKMIFDSVMREYKALYDESRLARYYCEPMTKLRATDAIKNLKHIEKHFP